MSMTATTASAWSRRPAAIIARPPTITRRAIAVIRDHPDNYDPGFEDVFQKLVDRLETQANAAAG